MSQVGVQTKKFLFARLALPCFVPHSQKVGAARNCDG